MDILDEQGRVFGRINVIDLLAVLFAFAVVVAGVTLVFSGGSSESPPPDSRYVTLDLGTQPGYVTERIDAGDVSPLSNSPGNLTITDVYAAPAGGSSSAVMVRARVTGQRAEDTDSERTAVTYAGDPLVLGRNLSIETGEYRLSGTVTDVSRSDASLPISTTDVLVTTTLSADAVDSLSVNDRYRENGRTDRSAGERSPRSVSPTAATAESRSLEESVLWCPACEFAEPALGSALRAGDSCPACTRGYLRRRSG